MALAGWPAPVASAFLESQFALQHRHFLTVGGATDFWIVEHQEEPIGRLYLGCGSSTWRVIDIALLPEWQGRGLGGALLDWVRISARAAKAEAVDLHVLTNNLRAAALYQRHGFAATDAGTPTHRHMIWRVS